MANFINLTPHAITIKNSNVDITIKPSGIIARANTIELEVGSLDNIPIINRRINSVEIGLIRDQITSDTILLVSSMVLDAVQLDHELRPFIFAPDTGSTAERNDKGQIISVSRLVTK